MTEHSTKTIDLDGSTAWKLPNGDLHREDGPAFVMTNGHKEWYINGQRHREDGPAIIYPNGTKYWCINGKLHRENGPAVKHANGVKEWWIGGKFIYREFPND